MPFIAFSPSLDRKIPLTGRRLNHRPTVILTGHALFFNKKEAESRQESSSLSFASVEPLALEKSASRSGTVIKTAL